MSPIGVYPHQNFTSPSCCLAVADEFCFSIVRLQDEWKHGSFSEIDSLLPIEIPLLSAFLLATDEDDRYLELYPTHQTIYLRSRPEQAISEEVMAEAREWFRAYLGRGKLESALADVAHRPPLIGGSKYELVESSKRDAARIAILQLLEKADPVTLRGLSSLIKANMAWNHRELNEAACISLWISLDAIHSLILQRLKAQGNRDPKSKDASDYIAAAYGIEIEDSIFADDYSNRIRAIHPDNRFGAEARPQFLADDFYELRHFVIELFHYLVTGRETKAGPVEFRGHAFHRKPL
jgi:hypothetical protein